MPFHILDSLYPSLRKVLLFHLKAGFLAYASLYSCPFPVCTSGIDNFISVTVAGAASDSHRFPYYP